MLKIWHFGITVHVCRYMKMEYYLRNKSWKPECGLSYTWVGG